MKLIDKPFFAMFLVTHDVVKMHIYAFLTIVFFRYKIVTRRLSNIKITDSLDRIVQLNSNSIDFIRYKAII